MSYLLVSDFTPVFVLRRVGTMNAAAMTAMTAEMKLYFERSHEKTAWVYDAGPVAEGRPDAASRQVVAQWFRDNGPLLVDRCAGFEFAFPSALSRGVLTAILWASPLPVPTHIHETGYKAIAAAVARVTASSPKSADTIFHEVEYRAGGWDRAAAR